MCQLQTPPSATIVRQESECKKKQNLKQSKKLINRNKKLNQTNENTNTCHHAYHTKRNKSN